MHDSVCLEIVLILRQGRAQFALNVPHAQKSFWTHPMVVLGDVGHVESCFGPFGDSVGVGRGRCMVCAKHTVGSEIVLDAPDSTPR
jgi:hypothetical protein